MVQSRFDWKHSKKGSHQRLATESKEEYTYIFSLSVKHFPVIRVSCAACWSHRWHRKSRLTLKVSVELFVCKWYLNWSLAVKDSDCLGAEAWIWELKGLFSPPSSSTFFFFFFPWSLTHFVILNILHNSFALVSSLQTQLIVSEEILSGKVWLWKLLWKCFFITVNGSSIIH